MSPGLLSAGLGDVPAAQTYLDISQGNRVFDSLYDSGLPAEVGGGICGPAYSEAVVERAESAPADIQPGLLAATLGDAGEGCSVRQLGLGQLGGLVEGLRGNDLLIAIERAPPEKNHALAIGIAGRGFDGNLTSDSTRTDGYVLTTDIGPTILGRLGIDVPSAMSGQPIRADGNVDVGAIESRGARMAVISQRRGPVIGVSLLVWLLVLGAAAMMTVGWTARFDVKLMALSVVYLPLVLLLASALRPNEGFEQILAMALAPALSYATLLALEGYRPLAVASGIVVLAYALDMLAGSPLTTLSLLGPNPGLGTRFYGIGNELEALLGVLVLGGAGAALTAYWPGLERRRVALAFVGSGLLFALIFAAGLFGADVGAAIVLPIGAAVAAFKVATPRRHAAPLIISAFLSFVGFIAVIDLLTGANAHLTRSVLDAGGLGDLGDVAQRRLQLSAHSFVRPIVLAFLPAVLAVAALALWRRDLLRSWLSDTPAFEAGLIGALVASVVGTLANDSGALVLLVASAYLLAFVGFAWAEGTRERAEREYAEVKAEREDKVPEEPVGREREQAEFERLLHQDPVEENLVFSGPPGVGKSMLLDSLKPRAVGRDWRWLPADLSSRTAITEEALAMELLESLAEVTEFVLMVPRVQRYAIGYAFVREPVQVPLYIGDLTAIYEEAVGPVSAKIEASLAAACKHIGDHAEGRLVFAYDEAQNLAERAAEGERPLETLLDAFHAAQEAGMPCLLVLTGSPSLYSTLVAARPFAARMFREMELEAVAEEDPR